jgi:hypothetical protein
MLLITRKQQCSFYFKNANEAQFFAELSNAPVFLNTKWVFFLFLTKGMSHRRSFLCLSFFPGTNVKCVPSKNSIMEVDYLVLASSHHPIISLLSPKCMFFLFSCSVHKLSPALVFCTHANYISCISSVQATPLTFRSLSKIKRAALYKKADLNFKN